MTNYEEQLRALKVIEKRRFTTAAGNPANRKVNLEKVYKKDPQLAAEIAGILAIRLCTHGRPDLIVPVPEGANAWGEDVALYMRSSFAKLQWQDKKTGLLSPATPRDQQLIEVAQRIAIVDDVFTTGGSIKLVSELEVISGKVSAAGVVWMRSHEQPNLNFPVESVVNSYVPLLEDE